ncbi:pti1-like tyrosine-protein kinase at3g15890 [Phtheirospermum japonicum]|uniref:Pti1-like tyrosine-protein kinase at3g15890 n=1 Tax=Phtheirospermum japonicum TaxID=374723 RepID=A0A830BVL6_9LAMI|nr:pti1-like tyrosine-protein kinase at3g15890 [Phtheirospermum japonicum]
MRLHNLNLDPDSFRLKEFYQWINSIEDEIVGRSNDCIIEIDIPETRLVVTKLGDHVLEATILQESNAGERTHPTNDRNTIRSQIAVKRLKSWSNKAEVEFSVEVEILAHVRHKNLLTLRGYCSEGQERLIVYDYMTNLSLLSHLHGQHSSECQLDWNRRMNIAIGAAEGVAYLHHHATPHIIHRDVKASNVLLDADFKAQVADFGFAKLIPDGATHVTTKVKGTLGYLAPEYAMLGKASESCDVYSFGILLLELASGKKPLEKISSTLRRPITDWALPLARERKLDEIADPRLDGKYVGEELKRVVLVGLMCARNGPEKRPTMLEVVDLLRGDNKEKFDVLESDEMFGSTNVVGDCGAEDKCDEETKQEIENV